MKIIQLHKRGVVEQLMESEDRITVEIMSYYQRVRFLSNASRE